MPPPSVMVYFFRGGGTVPLTVGSPSLLATYLTSPLRWLDKWTPSGIVVPLLLSVSTLDLGTLPCSRVLLGILSGVLLLGTHNLREDMAYIGIFYAGTYCKPGSTTPINTLDHHTGIRSLQTLRIKTKHVQLQGLCPAAHVMPWCKIRASTHPSPV